MHITFVVLHYLTLEDTIECVESIKNIKYSDYSIVIVDNGSPNKSGEILNEKYKNDNLVNVIISEENLGFAKGNNIGYRYAKENKKTDFIIMVNNDTIVNQKEFCTKLIENYEKDRFDIAGPKIISLVDKKNQNPIKKMFFNKKQVKITIIKLKILLLFNYLGFDKFIQLIYQKVKLGIKSLKKQNTTLKYEDIQLHGSCLIFSKRYINKYDGLFDKTFMYVEESILKYISDRDGLKMKYYENMYLYHKEDSSTNAFINNNLIKRRFYYKNSINSYNILYELMNN
ncbi:glycosyltransferase [Clostridium perfringens]|uniref:glycosyltransferase n=1 Tax=Clostridium perfringens TaxID=1502 RepID=UPI002AC7ADFF|nr:glycosyltransferase [Clostridium perfringens]MDZ4949058.1 glycosyltransferase [Clostridium perfringens]